MCEIKRNAIKITPYSRKAPCQDCKDRHIGCHSDCIKYEEYSSEIKRLKKIQEQKMSY